MTSVPELIARKRDGGALTKDELAGLIAGFTRGEVPDYQMSAFAMAVFFRGMTPSETAALTLAMRDSGRVVDLSSVRAVKVDKHSTGGVGDKVSICLAPLVVACGVPVPMISGRGLGHSGGTLDKLEAIPGFRVDLPVERFVTQVRELGCALIGQTSDLAPADKRLYALRDVTATVESIPLITASILSKKLAEGIDGLVMDVKVGRGAFMKTAKDARALAASIVRVAKLAGVRTTALLTAMDAPLGWAIGNALETAEALDVLNGGGPPDLIELTLALGAAMLVLGGKAKTEKIARAQLKRAIESGAGKEAMRKIVAAQGGDPRVVDDPLSVMARAPVVVPIPAPRTGVVTAIDALECGLASVALGAGRMKTDDVIDHAVGIVLAKKPGDRVNEGDALAYVHARDAAKAAICVKRVGAAYAIGKTAPRRTKLVLAVITA